MQSQALQGQDTASAGGQSLSRAFRASTSSLPVSRLQTSLRESKMSFTRAASTQPTYNLFTGEMNAPGASSRRSSLAHTNRAISHESAKENMAPPDAEQYETQRRRIEELKAEIGTMKFSISNLEQERELKNLQHEQELRELQARRDDDFKQKQKMQSERDIAIRKLESIQADMNNLRAGVSEDRTGLEKNLRGAKEEVRILQEQLEDLATSKEEAARISERRSAEVQGQMLSLERRVQELEQDAASREGELAQAQEQLKTRDDLVAKLEADVLRLKAQTGDAETIAIIRRELSEQVQHIRALEAANRDQISELKHLRQVNKSVGVLEEEKRSLLRKLAWAEVLERELDEAKLQRRRLEDEKKSWAAYLESVSSDRDLKFDSPAAVAKALVAERLNSASLLDQQGTLQAEISKRETTIKALTKEKKSLQDQLAKAKLTAINGSIDKSLARFERQRSLLCKEVEYLRAQLKAFDAEDVTFHDGENYDEQKAQRIQELEQLVDEYKEELQSLQRHVTSAEASGMATPPEPSTGSKRHRCDDSEAEEEQLGQLRRKNRKLQEELSTVNTKHQLLEKDLAVTQEQLDALKEQTKVRILALRSNPTSDFEAIKMSTLAALKEENADLLAHIKDHSNKQMFRTVPFSMLNAAQREIEEAHAETASAKKSIQRLKEVWSVKSTEFKEAIFSTLGWTVTFIPNGKMRVESVFYPSLTDEHENSIVFDGEKGTMKISGGARSDFAQRIAPQVKFWVREKNSIPGFLAALTLEFFDEQTRANAR